MSAPGPVPTPAQIAKGALRRLALAQLEPTPEHYARAWAEEAGQPPPPDTRAQGAAWASLIDKLVRGVERGGRHWTAARRKESLQRVLDGSRGDAQRLQQRLQSLLGAWDADRELDEPVAPPVTPADAAVAGASAATAQTGAAVAGPATGAAGAPEAVLPGASKPGARDGSPDDAVTAHAASSPSAIDGVAAAPADEAPAPWHPLVASLGAALRAGLPPDEPRAAEIATQLAGVADALAADGLSAERVAAVDALCQRARRLFAHRHHLVEQLASLCRELGRGLTEVAEDDSWARGQCEALEQRLAGEPSARGVRAAAELLAETRERQRRVRGERDAARDALKSLIHRMLAEVGELGEQTGRFHDSVGRHADAIVRAESLESLAGVVREIVDESRAVQQLVGAAQRRMQDEHAKAAELEARVRELEVELRRLSDEVSTDALTQVANRRGLDQAFDAERARVERAGDDAPPLAVGLIDIDNFKKLNDTLGHAAGDQALKTLAAAVRERLRPVDHLARFGGEEFVVLLPATPVAEAQQVLTRLQRSLTEALFLHEQREVFVTFSAGVTAWRPGEALEAALERADEALYEAKRTGKNRTCLG